ncbi:oxygenase MpaB family protein [Acinetobacter sp. YH12239]|uniref:oxygenase MpaB family protein n=1 Tax=Acinetobacter sp. YH12239 TaxID=2601166 RepID=UPI0015D14C27|nr:oxygenase MpaB family protein [Acinetobacter sp. YH12239]
MSNFSIPKRMASYERMKRSDLLSKLLHKMTDQNFIPTYAEYLELNESLHTGDVPMDRLMDWVMINPRENRKLFETALYQGLDALPKPIPEIKAFFDLVEQQPVWFDQEKIDRAIQFTHRLGSNVTFIMRDLALMTGYQYPGFNQPLILTGALSKYAGKRLAETHKWWLDVTKPNGFQRFNDGFTSTIFVRFIHSLVRYHLKKSKDWDWDIWGMPINQYDQAMTNIAFSGVMLLGIRAIGIFPTKSEVDAIMHFWKYTGWLMGVDEHWLIDKESEGWKLLQWMNYAHPQVDESSRQLAVSLSKEPFEREYKHFKRFMQKKAYQNHLDVTQIFMGRKKMKNLGLKPRILPWYPVYLLTKNTVIYAGAKKIPKLDLYLQRKGRSQQEQALDLYQNAGKQLASMHQ